MSRSGLRLVSCLGRMASLDHGNGRDTGYFRSVAMTKGHYRASGLIYSIRFAPAVPRPVQRFSRPLGHSYSDIEGQGQLGVTAATEGSTGQ